MSSLRHPNIVTFFGAGVDDEGNGFLITELMATGSLRGVLANTRDHTELSWMRRLQFSADIAAGMLFLHSRQPPMLHRDLMLLDERWVAKVSDFGTMKSVAKLREERPGRSLSVASGTSDTASITMTATGGCGTLLWAAPEVSASAYGLSHYGTPADVYSYGIVLYEIATRLLPYQDIDVNQFRLRSMIEAGDRPEIPAGIPVPSHYSRLMHSCWQGTAGLRPTFSKIVQEVEEMRRSSMGMRSGQVEHRLCPSCCRSFVVAATYCTHHSTPPNYSSFSSPNFLDTPPMECHYVRLHTFQGNPSPTTT